jgi:hypothetical protein
MGGPEDHFDRIQAASDEISMALEYATKVAELYFGDRWQPSDAVEIAKMILAEQRYSRIAS